MGKGVDVTPPPPKKKKKKKKKQEKKQEKKKTGPAHPASTIVTTNTNIAVAFLFLQGFQ